MHRRGTSFVSYRMYPSWAAPVAKNMEWRIAGGEVTLPSLRIRYSTFDITSEGAQRIAATLLPLPRKFQEAPGSCTVSPDGPITLQTDDPRLQRAVLRWRAETVERRNYVVELRAPARGQDHPGASVGLQVAVDPSKVPHRDGYHLKIQPDRIELSGGSPAGCFYGLQTLTQLSSRHDATVTCCTIVDWPDFDTRGVLQDVTRGRVPTLGTLKLLVDRLAALKVNQLQLYIEHAFVFSFDTRICAANDGLTPDEVRELDAYCAERFVELVPALATFGHMGRSLSMPDYRHLAEVETTKTWGEMAWPERLRGLTLDCRNPKAHQLVERMWSDVLDAFSAPTVNICGDEPWDLGQGKNRERFASGGKGEAYVQQIRRTHEICASRGRNTQFWSDIIRHYPELIARLPRNSTILHWGYDDRTDYEETGAFVAAGLNTFVCPGTSAWKRIFSAMDLAERNIAAFAAAGHRHGAGGLVNTDWGDHGHFNLPACSAHGLALGAALAWRSDHPTGPEFDRRFARVVLGVDDVTGIDLLRRASKCAARCETWRLLWMPISAAADDPSLPTLDDAVEMRRCASDLRDWCNSVAATPGVARQDIEELALAARFGELFADKVVFVHDTGGTSSKSGETPRDRNTWSDEVAGAARAYADCWHARNKPSGLSDILAALSAAAADVSG